MGRSSYDKVVKGQRGVGRVVILLAGMLGAVWVCKYVWRGFSELSASVSLAMGANAFPIVVVFMYGISYYYTKNNVCRLTHTHYMSFDHSH